MNRIKLLFRTDTYLSSTVTSFLIMAVIFFVLGSIDRDYMQFIMILFLVMSPIWLVEWLIKYKYFEDIILKKVKYNKGTVVGWDTVRRAKVLYPVLKVSNSKSGKIEKVTVFEKVIGKERINWYGIKEIEYTYLENSKVLVELINYK